MPCLQYVGNTRVMIQSRFCQAFLRPNTTVRSAGAVTKPGCRQSTVRHQHFSADSSHLPRIAQASLWESIFPKSLRERAKQAFRPSGRQSVNPATYFIWIYLLIGSQAIRIIGIQNDFDLYMRRADLKIEKLREVVKKLQLGEPVDVEKVLGTGDEEQEDEWEKALKDIENEEQAWQEGKKKRMEDEQRREAEMQDASPVSDKEVKLEAVPDLPTSIPRPPSQPGFY